MFLNISNHPSSAWSAKQLEAAKQYGEIADLAFPNVPPSASKEEVQALAESVLSQAMQMNPDCVMCSGEYTLTYALVNGFKAENIKTVAACTERKTEERTDENGRTVRTSIIEFVCFREF